MIIDIMKEIAVSSVTEEVALQPIFGKVLSISPFSATLDQKLTLQQQDCILLKNALNKLAVGDSVLILARKNTFIVLGGIL